MRVAPPLRLTRTTLVTGIDPLGIRAKTGPPAPETGPVGTGAPGLVTVPVGTGATGVATARPVSKSLRTTEAPDPRRPPPEGSNEARLAAPTRQPGPNSKKERRRLRSRLLRQPPTPETAAPRRAPWDTKDPRGAPERRDRSEVQPSPEADEVFEEEADEVFEEETEEVAVEEAEEVSEETSVAAGPRVTLDIKSLQVPPRAGTPALEASEPEGSLRLLARSEYPKARSVSLPAKAKAQARERVVPPWRGGRRGPSSGAGHPASAGTAADSGKRGGTASSAVAIRTSAV